MRTPPPRRSPFAGPGQSRPGPGRSPQAEPIRHVMQRLCEQPTQGLQWTPPLLAATTGLAVSDVKHALNPGPELVKWSVYERLLYHLEADTDDHEVCRRSYDQLSRQLQPHQGPPDDIARIVTETDFATALVGLSQRSGMSRRGLAEATRRHSPRYSWSKSGIEPYITGQKLPPAAKPQHLRTLLTVLCEAAGRDHADVEHYLEVWRSLHTYPQSRSSSTEPDDSTRPERRSVATQSQLRLPRLSLSPVTLLAIVLLTITLTTGVVLLA